MARTKSCSRTPSSTRCTSRCRTRCTTSGRCARSPPASTSSARSRTRAIPTRWARRTTRRTQRVSCSPRRTCGATPRRPRLLVELLPRIGPVHAIHAAFFGILPRDGRRAVRPAARRRCAARPWLLLHQRGALIAGGSPTTCTASARSAEVGSTSSSSGRCGSATSSRRSQCGFTSRGRTTSTSTVPTACSASRSHSSTRPASSLLDGVEHRVDPGNHYRAELDDFCAAVRGERAPLRRTRRDARPGARAGRAAVVNAWDPVPDLEVAAALGTKLRAAGLHRGRDHRAPRRRRPRGGQRGRAGLRAAARQRRPRRAAAPPAAATCRSSGAASTVPTSS